MSACDFCAIPLNCRPDDACKGIEHWKAYTVLLESTLWRLSRKNDHDSTCEVDIPIDA